MKVFSCIISALMLIFTLFCACTTADDVDVKKDELKKIEEQIKGKKEELEKMDEKEKDLLSQLDEMEKHITFNYVESKRLQKKIMSNEEQVREIERELIQIDKKQQQIKGILKYRLRNLYKLGRRSWLEILLTSPDIINFYRKLKLTREIAKSNSHILSQIIHYKDKRIELRDKLKSDKANLYTLKGKADVQLNKYKDEMEDKQEYVQEVISKKHDYSEVLKRLERQAKELEALIKKISSGRVKKKRTDSMMKDLKPVLDWPVNGDIIGSFGKYKDPEIDEYKYRDGIYIKVSEEQDVLAAADGKVAYRGWFKGRGNIIIIEHPNSITAVYGHLGQIKVEKGDKVYRGQSIATTGDTGYLGQSSFYFGVWYAGNVIDPILVLKY